MVVDYYMKKLKTVAILGHAKNYPVPSQVIALCFPMQHVKTVSLYIVHNHV